jgi:hypothetical protein
MDPNSTYQIFLNPTINATLNQQPQGWYGSVLTFPVGLAIGVLLGAIIINLIEYSRKRNENKINVYSRLRGKQVLLLQLYRICGDYSINIKFHRGTINRIKRSEHITCNDIGDMEYSEETIKRLSIKFDERIIELAKIREKWWVEMGLAQTLFGNLIFKFDPQANNIQNADSSIIRFVNFDSQANIIQNAELSITNFMNNEPDNIGIIIIDESWRIGEKKILKNLEDKLQKNIDILLEEIDRDLKTKSWWKFWK